MGFIGYVVSVVGAALVVVFGFGLVQAILVGFGYRFGGSAPHPQVVVLLTREWLRRVEQFGTWLGVAAAIAYGVASTVASGQVGWQEVVGVAVALPLVWLGASTARAGVVSVRAILALRSALGGEKRRSGQRRRELAALAEMPEQGQPSNSIEKDMYFLTTAQFQTVEKGVSRRQVDQALTRMNYISANLSLLYLGHPVIGVYGDIRYLRKLGKRRWGRARSADGYDPDQVRLVMAGFSLLAYELERLQIACHLLSDAIESGAVVPPQEDERPNWFAWTKAPCRGEVPKDWEADTDDLYWPPLLARHHLSSPMGSRLAET